MRIGSKLVLIMFLAISSVEAKIGNSREENFALYGAECSVEEFSSSGGFTGYISYSYSPDWKIVAFYKKGKVRSEHFIAHKENSSKTMTRDEVKALADKMFEPNQRGSYQRELSQAKVDGHFFNKGMVAYEKLIEGKKLKGYNGIKVLLYDGDASFSGVNPRALI